MTYQKKRDYCFTINNYTEDDLAAIDKLKQDAKTRYIIVAREVGEEGTPHIQGYIYFHHMIAFSTMKKLLPRAHLEPARGSPEQNREYCSKDGEFYESGDIPISQKRKGQLGAEYWATNKRLAIEGKFDEIDPKLFVTHYRTLKAIRADNLPMPEDNEDLDNHWYWGDTGCGKSYKARTDHPGHYLKMCNRWWDGYNGEDTAIIEDFDKNHSGLGHYLKIWADRYAFPAEIKGSKVNLRPKTIIITSNWHPSDIWTQEPKTLEPILRRFRITHFSKELNQASP